MKVTFSVLLSLMLGFALTGGQAFAAEKTKAAKASSTAMPTSPDASASDEEGIPNGRFLAGGIVGTAVGLGIGHGIQKRYFPLGLIFSLGEAAGYVCYLADYHIDPNNTSVLFPTHTVGTVGVIGIIAVAALRIWEIADVWIVGNELNKKWKAHHAMLDSLSVAPIVASAAGTAPGVTLGLRF